MSLLAPGNGTRPQFAVTVFSTINLTAFLIALAMLSSGLLSDGMVPGTIVSACFAAIFGVLFFISRVNGPNFVLRWIFVFIGMVLVVLEWHFVTGFFGYAFIFALILAMVLPLVMQKREAIIALAILGTLIIVLFIIEVRAPAAGTVDAYAQIGITDHFLNILALAGIAALIGWLGAAEIRAAHADIDAIKQSLRTANALLQRTADLDGLTQIANRRRFGRTLDREWYRHTREQKPIALILGDIDNFRQYNEMYGPVQGDECLQKVGQALNVTVKRPTDLAARFDGDEFAVLLPNTDTDGAVTIAGELQDLISALGIEHFSSETTTRLSVSFGVAALVPGADTNVDVLIRSAEEALYRAKTNGRDRLEYSGELSRSEEETEEPLSEP